MPVAPYLAELRAALAERGVLFDHEGTLSLDPSYSGADAPTPAQLDYFNRIRDTRAAYSRVQLAWAQDLAATVHRLLSGTSTDPTALRVVMFLRLHGFLVEFAFHYRASREILGQSSPRAESDGAVLFSVLVAIDEMRAALTEDELLYLEYRRHVGAHMWQGAYDLQWNKKRGVAQTPFDSKVTGKTYNRKNVDDRLAGVVREFGSEEAIALAFANRLEGHADRLLSSMQKFCSPSH